MKILVLYWPFISQPIRSQVSDQQGKKTEEGAKKGDEHITRLRAER